MTGKILSDQLAQAQRIMDFGDIMITIISTLLGGLVTHLVIRANLRRRDLWTAATGGCIYPNPVQFVPIALLFAVLAAGCGYGMYRSYVMFLYGQIYLFGAGFALCVLFCWSFLCVAWDRACHVTWGARGLVGPVNYWFFPFGPRCARIEYAQIVSLGIDYWGSFFVVGPSGAAIRWSYMYKGFAALNMQIETQRPDLIGQWPDGDVEDDDDWD